MKINALTVSVNYADFLSHTLPSMRGVFDRLVVVTSPDDKETQKLCKYWWVECLITDIMYKDSADFNKGLAIQFGLDYLKSDDWICHIDSDIYLPPRFNEFIRCKNLVKDNIYGIDRLDVKDWATWINFYSKPFSMHNGHSVWSGLPVMYRCLSAGNYIPIGYFQLWNAKSKYYKEYNDKHTNAAGSDLDFANNWPAENRILIPELYVYHLSSEEAEIGTNWFCRKTRQFGE